ncbi:MAG: hypothetical protein O7G85_03565 [Planctomycetota bacterium]|nr:hypothetical protein [Planctomycetota bacterium]
MTDCTDGETSRCHDDEELRLLHQHTMYRSPLAMILFGLIAFTMHATAQESAGPDWPFELQVENGMIVIYQPQLESFEGITLKARSAAAFTRTGEEEPVFGVVWFEAQVNTDRNNRTVKLEELKVTKVHVPKDSAATPEQLEEFKTRLSTEMMKWVPELSLDRLLASMASIEKRKQAASELKNTPPKIIFVSHPALLITLDGEPRLEPIDNSKVMRVVNTPFVMLFEPASKAYYLTDGTKYMTTMELNGFWVESESPSPGVKAVFGSQSSSADPRNEEDEGVANFDKHPEIVIATVPTELISSDGSPQYTPIENTTLLYMANTSSDVFLDIDTQNYYVLLSGRWYTNDSMEGDWQYVSSDELPEGFKVIPEHSPKATVLPSIAGTQEAIDAVNDSQIPQTSRIDRNGTITVEYDGAPHFEKVEDSSVVYATNTASSILMVNKIYYCCNQAVWYCAENATGPWIVCSEVPDEIYTIPPSCPLYNVTYVRVYSSTPNYVYVGYYPGYIGCYPYHGVVVYGTGYYYRPWHGNYYYARPCTYGVSIRYNSYTGNWGVRVSYGHHGVAVWGHNGYWGAGGCRGYGDVSLSRTVTTPRGTFTNEIDIERDRHGLDIDQNISWEPNDNLYDRQENRQRNMDDRRNGQDGRSGDRRDNLGNRRADGSRQRENNVFADRDGNIHRKTDQGWEKRQDGGWSKNDRTSNQNRQRDLNRDSQSRDHGTNRTRQYNQRPTSRSPGNRTGGRSGGGGRSRGGGGRRGR